MDPLNLSWYDDDLERQNWSRPFNGSEGKADRPHYNYYAMLLTLLIFVIVFGNVLVCMAVSREKALQTTTNYLIVSLAVADLLVATLVMPWVVYLEVVGEWKFSRIHCDIFVTLDVMMCTASILNLCAISIDRYTAVAMPMLYNTRYSSKRRVTVMIAIVWVLSFTISCPLLFGLNNTDQNECIIANPAFVVYSSIVSFYVPFIVTLLVYIKIYIVLRKRRKRVNTKRSSRAFRANLKAPLKEAARRAQELEMEMLSSTSPPERTRYSPIPPSHHQLTLPDPSHHGLHSTPDSPAKPEKNGHAKDHPKIAKIFEIQSMPNGKTRTSLKTMSRRKLSQQKEKKATQMLAIVLGVFIICWLPFFITHILNIHCDCNIPPVLYSAFTWLGYVNSAVNPIIYTTFNIEFRKAFMKILHC
ncbi:D(2) dopamine receptor isoform X2 [Marmota monax]|uniref:D(2) dopamine receptor n=1 Tax=Ictidomys tridecemlineatus TaxID=43179 RepID=A0A287CXF0_ICTTR|nr:D(2) dopamine receptor isoform X2 [Ictidomys tridecemlineatus]XP_026248358.1 D(2) dopamine receptor isoform X2 [Urocitellus parryii]XP_027786448.1 D(2) dopamine receptor isoform X2 [Marmota flaviventris]XP_058442198.1 D(2) dopamine receptor isoform X2 [Marmota monax]KAG3286563.1 dopamine receptor D2, transcript variant X4 [Ictidomys tridecemlineatus]